MASWEIDLWMFVNWSVSLMVTTIPLFTGDYSKIIEIESNSWNCVLLWRGYSPSNLLVTFSCILLFAVSFFGVHYCYYKVFKIFQAASQAKGKKNHVVSENAVLVKCVSITASFWLSWSPTMLKVLYEFVSEQRVPLWAACIAGFTAAMNASINPVLLLLLDNRVSGNAKKFLEIKFDSFSPPTSPVDEAAPSHTDFILESRTKMILDIARAKTVQS